MPQQYLLLPRRQLFDGFFDLGERAHGGESNTSSEGSSSTTRLGRVELVADEDGIEVVAGRGLGGVEGHGGMDDTAE